jgi:hypothetical protein
MNHFHTVGVFQSLQDLRRICHNYVFRNLFLSVAVCVDKGGQVTTLTVFQDDYEQICG